MCEKNKKPQETIELNDDQLEQASGGESVGDREEMFCRQCGMTVHEYNEAGRWHCTVCGCWFINGFVP